MTLDPGDPGLFPPQAVVSVKALACEIPARTGLPLSRFSTREIALEVVRRGIVTAISGATVWRWLRSDVIRPWRYRSWIFPRDPDFETKAGRVLDLYQRMWNNEPLGDGDYVVCADEKPSIQARVRIHASEPAAPKRAARIEHEYERGGALTYIAAWDVLRARIFGRCEKRSGIKPFERLVKLIMTQEPYRSARRVFLIMDNGSSHRGQPCIERLTKAWPNLVPVHLPVHASWLNQAEIYFSIVQRKVLTPNDFPSLQAVAQRLLDFQDHYGRTAKPHKWKFTRQDMRKILDRLRDDLEALRLAA